MYYTITLLFVSYGMQTTNGMEKIRGKPALILDNRKLISSENKIDKILSSRVGTNKLY